MSPESWSTFFCVLAAVAIGIAIGLDSLSTAFYALVSAFIAGWIDGRDFVLGGDPE